MSLWIPTLLTGSRAVAGPIVLWSLLSRGDGKVAFWVFTFAMFTDLFDGWAARKVGSDPKLGAFLDPFCDKILVSCSWLGLWLIHWVPWWLIVPMVVRDLCVAFGWFIYRMRGITIQPTPLAQVMVAYEGTSLGLFLFHGPFNGVDWPSVAVVLGVMSLGLSILTALIYLFQDRTKRAEPG